MFKNLLRTLSSSTKFGKSKRSFFVNLRTNSRKQNSSHTTNLQISNCEASKYLQKGSQYLDINQTKAKDFFLQAIEHSRNLKIGSNEVIARAAYELSQIYLDERNLSKAQNYLEEALKNAKGAAGEMSELTGDVFYALSWIMLTKGELETAQEYLKSYLELAENGLFKEENVARAELELGKLQIDTDELHVGKERIVKALEYFEEEGDVTKEAECCQVLGEYFRRIGDYEAMFQKNLDCLNVLKEHSGEIESSDELKMMLMEGFTEAGSSLNKLRSKRDTEKAILYLEHAIDLFNGFDEQTRIESAGVLAKILANALSLFSRGSDKNQCKRIIEEIEAEEFGIKDFQSAEEFRDFVITYSGALMNLKMFEQGYQVIKNTNIKYFENSSVDRNTRAEFYSLYNKFSYENNQYEDVFSTQKNLQDLYSKKVSLSKEEQERLFSSSTNSLKSFIKLYKNEDQLKTEWQDAFSKWNQLAQTVENRVLIRSVQDIFITFLAQEQYNTAESFLSTVLSFSNLKEDQDSQKLINTYQAILNSKTSNFSESINYALAVKTGILEDLKSLFSSSSSSLFSKVTNNSTLIKECSETLHQLQATASTSDSSLMQTLSSLWNLCHQYIRKSDLQTSLLLLDEIQRLSKERLEGSTDFQGNIQILQVLIELEMGEFEKSEELLKEFIESKELSCRKEFVTLVYLLYGDVMKGLNSGEEAMLMWMKAVDSYLKMRKHQSKDLATKNANLFENLLSKRSDLLPETYRVTIETSFKC